MSLLPDQQIIDELCSFAFTLIEASQAKILPVFRKPLIVENKQEDGFDPVTIADRSAEQIMRQMIEEQYPEHGINGEEFSDKPAKGDFTWVLDPIDGTRAFIAGLTSWTTLIGLEYRDRPVLGFMHQPYVGETFYGTPQAAFVKKDGVVRPINTNGADSLGEALVTTTGLHYYQSNQEIEFLEKLRLSARSVLYDGDAYFYSLLAAGQVDIALDARMNRCDIAPLIPIVEGAGGIITTWDGESARNGGNIIAAANRQLYDAAVKLL